jgi:hypothetical protein
MAQIVSGGSTLPRLATALSEDLGSAFRPAGRKANRGPRHRVSGQSPHRTRRLAIRFQYPVNMFFRRNRRP